MFLFSLMQIGFLGPPGSRGFVADRCRWQEKEGGEGEKQGVCRLNAERESRRLCFEVGLRRFKSCLRNSRILKSILIFCFVERKPLIYIKNV